MGEPIPLHERCLSCSWMGDEVYKFCPTCFRWSQQLTAAEHTRDKWMATAQQRLQILDEIGRKLAEAREKIAKLVGACDEVTYFDYCDDDDDVQAAVEALRAAADAAREEKSDG